MGLMWLTLGKAFLAVIILGLLLARLPPLPMIAILAPFAVAEVIYIYTRWSVSWDDYLLVLMLLTAAGQVAWLGGVAVLFGRRRQ